MARKETKRTSSGNGQLGHSVPEVSDQSVRELAQVFKLLSDETRLRILFYLALSPDGELHVTDLCHRLGQSQPAVSHHLALLRVSGLIESRREGKHNFYSRADRSLRRTALEPVLRGRRGSTEQEVPFPRFRPELLGRVNLHPRVLELLGETEWKAPLRPEISSSAKLTGTKGPVDIRHEDAEVRPTPRNGTGRGFSTKFPLRSP